MLSTVLSLLLPVLSSEGSIAPDDSMLWIHSRNMGENTTSKNIFITIMKLLYLPHPQCSGLCMNVKMASHIEIHTFSKRLSEYFAALYFLVFQHTYAQICSNKNTYSYNICISHSHSTRTRISNKQYSKIILTCVVFTLFLEYKIV